MSIALCLNNASFRSPDVARQIGYYEEVIGLHVTDRAGDGVYLGTRSGTDAVVLAKGAQTQLRGLTFQAAPDHDLRETLKTLETKGVTADVRSDPHPSIATSLVLTDPNGLEIELVSDRRLRQAGPTRGVAPLRIGHVACVVPDVLQTSKFFQDVLGFRIGDWVDDYFVFLRCAHEHHSVNFIQSDRVRMHHMAFEMQDTGALMSACDVLARAKYSLMWGPLRHGPGHNIATYHKNLEGQIIELYSEMDFMTNEALGYYDPRPWHTDFPQRPKVWSTKGPRRDIWGPVAPPNFLADGV